MYGTDVERVLTVINKIKDTAGQQIELLVRESDHRLETISHTHNVHIVKETGSPEGTPDADPDPSAPHTHGMDIKLQGDSPTGGIGTAGQVSDQLTYPGDYSNDQHAHHQHVESSMIYEKEHPVAAATYVADLISLGAELEVDRQKFEHIETSMNHKKEEWNNEYGSPWTEVYNLKNKITALETYANEYPNLQWIGEKYGLISLMQVIVYYAIDAKWALTLYHHDIQDAYDCEYNDKESDKSWDKFTSEVNKTDGTKYQEFEENARVKGLNKDPF